MKSMAVVMREAGAPSVLHLEEVALPPLRDGEVRIRSLASAVNHSDLEIRAGAWNIRRTPQFPYVPGLEVVGEVADVASGVTYVRPGDVVWTTMQGLGGVRAEIDGGYAEHVTVSSAAVALLPSTVDPIAFAAVGLAGVTAYMGLRKLGDLSGQTLIVTGPEGGVGSMAVLLARELGANVIEHGRGAAPLLPRMADAVLDVVAGPMFPELVTALRHGGRYCLVGAVAGGDVCFDAWSLIEGITLTGYSTEDITGDELRTATDSLLLRIQLPDTKYMVLPLSAAARAHAMLESREVKGRIVLIP